MRSGVITDKTFSSIIIEENIPSLNSIHIGSNYRWYICW